MAGTCHDSQDKSIALKQQWLVKLCVASLEDNNYMVDDIDFLYSGSNLCFCLASNCDCEQRSGCLMGRNNRYRYYSQVQKYNDRDCFWHIHG